MAVPWFKVSDEGRTLEGPAFDRNGDLLFCDVSGRRVLRLTPGKKLTTVFTLNESAPGGVAVHKDGRIFIAALDVPTGSGSVPVHARIALGVLASCTSTGVRPGLTSNHNGRRRLV